MYAKGIKLDGKWFFKRIMVFNITIKHYLNECNGTLTSNGEFQW